MTLPKSWVPDFSSARFECVFCGFAEWSFHRLCDLAGRNFERKAGEASQGLAHRPGLVAKEERGSARLGNRPVCAHARRELGELARLVGAQEKVRRANSPKKKKKTRETFGPRCCLLLFGVVVFFWLMSVFVAAARRETKKRPQVTAIRRRKR